MFFPGAARRKIQIKYSPQSVCKPPEVVSGWLPFFPISSAIFWRHHVWLF
jgi:hypothetical protein